MEIKNTYHIITSTWNSSFKNNTPCRGFQLESLIKSMERIEAIVSIEHKEVSKEEFNYVSTH